MATWMAAQDDDSPTARRRAVSRRRWSVASTIEILIEPALAPGPRLNAWPRIPHANRVALIRPMREIVALLRDPAIAIPEGAEERILALATHPSSSAFGRYPVQAHFYACALLDELQPAASVLTS
jgi:hypothetical protein